MFFSAFLVIAYVICGYFILQLSSTMTSINKQMGVTIALIVGFGAMLFYATRVGDGKQVMRFSPSVLVLMVLPSVYAICAYFAIGLPLHTQISDYVVIMYLAAVTLGYGLPYTFTSGFEMVAAEDVYYPEHFEDGDDNKVKAEKSETKKKDTSNKKKK